MTSNEPPRKQQKSPGKSLAAALEPLALGERGEALKRDLLDDGKYEKTLMPLLRLLAAHVKSEEDMQDQMEMIRGELPDFHTGSFEVSSGRIVIDNLFGEKVYSEPALTGVWNFLVEDNDEGDKRVCKCYHSSYPLLDSGKKAEREAMDATFEKSDHSVTGQGDYMFICDEKYYADDSAVPQETTVWNKEGDKATKWHSFYATLGIDALMEHPETDKGYGFMLSVPDEQSITVYKKDNAVVGIAFETDYGDDDDEDGPEDDEFKASDEEEEDDE